MAETDFGRLTMLAAGSAHTQTNDDVLRVDTDMVVMPVRVADRLGHSVDDLTKGQFHVYEDGIEQDIAQLEAPLRASPSNCGSSTQSAPTPRINPRVNSQGS